MKKLNTLLAVTAIFLSLSGKAQAVPVYYTFEGTVTNTYDTTGTTIDASLSAGSSVTYTFVVDFDVDGFYTLSDGTDYNYSDSADYDVFYTDYISGDAIAQTSGGTYGSDGNSSEYNFGFNSSTSTVGALVGNFSDDMLFIYSYSADVSDWAVGDIMSSYNQAFGSAGAISQLSADLTLTRMSGMRPPRPHPVPEPSTLLLLGSGMLGFFVFRRRQLSVKA